MVWLYMEANTKSQKLFPFVKKKHPSVYRIAHLTAPCPLHKQEGPEALNRSPEYTGQKSNI